MTLEPQQRTARTTQSSQTRPATPPAATTQTRGTAKTLTPAPGYRLNPNGYPVITLDNTQIQKAITWYQNNSALYAPRAIKEIQQRLKLATTGKVDLTFIRAVAQWQNSFDLIDTSNREIPLRSGKVTSAYPATGVLTAEQLSSL